MFRRAVPQNLCGLCPDAHAKFGVLNDTGMVCLGEEKIMPAQGEELIRGIYELAQRDMGDYLRTGDDDFSFSVPGLARFRVNAYRQRGSCAVVVRVVAFSVPDWQQLGIPETVMSLADLTNGMVLVAGTAGCGKSTTQTALEYADNPEQMLRRLD